MKRKVIFFLIFFFISVFLFAQNPKNEKKRSRPVLSQAPPSISSFYESGRDVKTKGPLFQVPRSFLISKDRHKKDYEAGVQAKESQITGLSCVQIGPTGGDVAAAEVYNDNLYILTKGYPNKLYRFENDEWKKVLSINERCYGLHINNNGDMCIPGEDNLYVLRSGEASSTSFSYPEGFAITTSEIEEYAPYRIDSSPSDPNNVWVSGEKDSQASVARIDISAGIISIISVRIEPAIYIQQEQRQVALTVARGRNNQSEAILGGITYNADGSTAPWLYYTTDNGSSWTNIDLPAGTESVFGAKSLTSAGNVLGARSSANPTEEYGILTSLGLYFYARLWNVFWAINIYATSIGQNPNNPAHIFAAGWGTFYETKDWFATYVAYLQQFLLWANCCAYHNGNFVVGSPFSLYMAAILINNALMQERSKNLYSHSVRYYASYNDRHIGQVRSWYYGVPDTSKIGWMRYNPSSTPSWAWQYIAKPDKLGLVGDIEIDPDGVVGSILSGDTLWKLKWTDPDYLIEPDPVKDFSLIPFIIKDIDLYTDDSQLLQAYGTGAVVDDINDRNDQEKWKPAAFTTNAEDQDWLGALGRIMAFDIISEKTGISKFGKKWEEENIGVALHILLDPSWGVYSSTGDGYTQKGPDLEGIDHIYDAAFVYGLGPFSEIQSKAQETTYTIMLGTSEGPYGFDGTDWVKLADLHVFDLEGSTEYSKIVFAGGQDGLYFTEDFGVTWQEIELQPSDESEVQLSAEDDEFEPWISSVHLDDERKALFIGTWGSSTLRLDVASLFKKILTISAGTGGTTDPSPGAHEYNIGDTASVKANANSGYTFSKWTGNVPSGKETTNPVEIIMDAVKSITANFTQTSTGGGGGDTGDGGGGCFIATACYGTPMAEEVKVLSAFRDKYLITNPVGQAFVKLYHKHSPAVADFIRDKEQLKAIVREFLRPIIYVISNIVE